MTPYGQCSTTKPKYCDSGTLIDNCQVCGCGSGYECQTDGSCIIPSACGEIVQITTNTAKQINPKIYGNKITWLDYRNGDRDTYMYDLSTGQETRVSTISAERTLGRDFYGDKIVWADNRNGEYDVFMYDLSTGQETQLSTGTERRYGAERWYYPAIYGDKVVWAYYVLLTGGYKNIFMYDLSTGQETQITTNAKSQFSIDIYGNKVVWADYRNGNSDIYMYDLSTGQETQITTNTANQTGPTIHGDKIVWVDDRNNNTNNIYMYNLSTGQETQISTTTSPASSSSPAIYGDKIVWDELWYNGGGHQDIYMYDLSTGQETKITTSPKRTTATGWYMVLDKNPVVYGDKIVWTGKGDGNWDIYMTTICQTDVTPPTISNIQVSNITPTSATITWRTNEESSSVVDYGLTTAEEFTVSGETGLYHEVNLSNLINDTTYYYRVKSIGNVGNRAQSSDKTFTTIISLQDITPPVISNINNSNITEVSAKITWTTDEASDSQVEYGLTTNYGNSSEVDSVLTENHNIILTGLAASTTYHYRVGSTDDRDNTAWSEDRVFTTLVAETHQFITKWGDVGSGYGQFDHPFGIAVDSSDNVYVVDTYNNRIQKFDSEGNLITILGSSGSGDGHFYRPRDIAIDSSGNIYVADKGHDRIQKFDSEGNFITKWYFNYPGSIAVDSLGNVYVTDQFNHQVQKFDSSGVFITKWGSTGSGDGKFKHIYGIAVDSSDNVYIVDRSSGVNSEGIIYAVDPDNERRVQKFDSSGNFITKWGSYGSGDGEFDRPTRVAIDSSDNVYIVDQWNHRIQKFTSDGTLLGWWGRDDIGNTGWHNPGSGRIGVYGYGDGQFFSPRGVAVDSSGNVYMTDRYFRYRIQKFK